MTDLDNVLAGGLLGAVSSADEFADVRALVDELSQRSFDARLGRRRRPEAFDGPLWNALQDTGLARLTSDAENGAGPADLAVVLYGLARRSAAVPVAETDLLAAWLGQQAGVDVPIAGPLTAARTTGAVRDGIVTGTATGVPWARAADALVLLIDTGASHYVGAFGVDGLVTDAMNLAGEPRDDVGFGLPLARLTSVGAALADEFDCRGAWARCIQIVGALDAAAASAVTHCRERVQFGRPLSRIQSVQQALATMAGDIERGRAAVTLAVAAAIDFGFGSGRTEYAVAVAKAVLGPVVAAVTTAAHQLHGAIGTSVEHPLWASTLRARSWTDEFGSAGHHARRVGHLALSCNNVWDCVTGRF
ncbi:acyl-CoA dehydrogenase family protein [Mycobacterium sp. 050128]|uniref:acyl-CoA dehydrogenase family protein n=1 Tax=Mycobacterium sp. 050128 TaxID=3096112 RepID=UPI002ED7C624